ncbi:uncharacterized protein LOC122262357 [Penaeus japonicus]|uniref:uncharacterized protein LOC122262357 n=1 Tax=Penaeus japonicus TaxID=27405 RepID=UPI001C7100F0|nr:uncharacterized protein LOC122262357 [Penaeus japonicus]
MELVPLDVLWCQCQGNASATPHLHQIHSQVAQMHADAAHHALCYVGVVVSLYLLGLAAIIGRSGRSERQAAASALASCLSGAIASVGRLAASVGSSRPAPTAPTTSRLQPLRPTVALLPVPLQQMPGAPPPRAHAAPRSSALQLQLVVPDDDDDLELSMITSVA